MEKSITKTNTRRLSPASTVLLTIFFTLLAIVVARIILFIIAKI